MDTNAISMNRINEIPVGVDMPVGTTFMVAVENTAGQVEQIDGAYRYEIIP
ncbi:unnamed protein product [marine sediment metagenome]|uniref:Uncharacterized protein n=1 Tax=marine sediment metagenome TaxID=412755 RepID=X1V2P4_9ZZZZ